MGFGWNTRNAEDVQRQNGQQYDFNKIKQAYESIKPLRGKRSSLDIRPHGERSRSHERIVRVSDTEYFLTNQAYAYWENRKDPDRNLEHNRAMTFSMVGDIEYLTVHTPRQYWGDNTKVPFAERKVFDTGGFTAPSNYYFYAYNLPQGVYMTKFGSKAYLEVRSEDGKVGKCYTLMQGDVVLTRKQGENFFRPLVVHRETKRSIDRKQTKTIRQELEPFVNYVTVMLPLMEYKHVLYAYKNPFNLNKWGKWDTNANPDEGYKDIVNKSWSELVSMKGDELPEYWFNMAQSYRSRMETRKYNWDTKQYEDVPINFQRVKKAVYDDVYRQAKPFKTEDVELGKAFKNNKYHSW
jgi:hypothetical protein